MRKRTLIIFAFILYTTTVGFFDKFSPVIDFVIEGNDTKTCAPRLFFNNKTNKTVWTCKPVRFSTVKLPVTALISYPGSGNTWFRHLLQQATGILTGSVYNDPVLRKGGFPAAGITNGSVLAVKMHVDHGKAYNWGLKKFDRAILLIRDPIQAGLAEFQRKRKGHVGTVDAKKNSKAMSEFLQKELWLWNFTYYNWLKIKEPLHMVWYSDLKTNLRQEMEKIFKFLNVTVSECDMTCMLKNQEGRFHRRRARNHTISIKHPPSYERKVQHLTSLFRKMYNDRDSGARL